MKRKGHKHKESFSILFISHAGQRNRQFNISRTAGRVILCLAIILLIVLGTGTGLFGWLVYGGAVSGSSQKDLQAQIDAQQQQIVQLESEKDDLSSEKAALEQEVAALQQSNEMQAAEQAEAEAPEETTSDDDIPRRYPSPKTSVVISSFSEEEPYLAIGLHEEGNIVATGNGTVISVSSDDTYPVIIEIEHAKGYKTRYMCRHEAEVQTAEGAQVEAGDTLFTITVEDSQVDYQILFEGEPIDPLTVIEAKG
ncbi:MAG: M23 family metallopeptidase [Roseburia sp.]|nr:M23 family metallopeptidase [Roseburia sp.]